MGRSRTAGLLETSATLGILIVLAWLTHALAFFAHEYAHSFTAWAFGYKTNPLALHYGHASWLNLLDQFEIDENVDYFPIFAAHRGGVAAVIAMAGVLFGNGLLYLASQAGFTRARRAEHRNLALFWLLLILMNVGNFISYVPIRTFATHADMATVEQGLNLSPWWLILFPGLPFLLALVRFEDVSLPRALRYFYPGWQTGRLLLLIVCCAMLFGFYGAPGFSHYGPIPLALSRICVWVLLPCSVLIGWLRTRKQ